MQILVGVAIASYTVITLFIYCVVGEMVSDEFRNCCDVVYNSIEWDECSPQSRRYLVMIIRQTQQPLHLRSFGLGAWECSLENFMNVIYFSQLWKTILPSNSIPSK